MYIFLEYSSKEVRKRLLRVIRRYVLCRRRDAQQLWDVKTRHKFMKDAVLMGAIALFSVALILVFGDFSSLVFIPLYAFLISLSWLPWLYRAIRYSPLFLPSSPVIEKIIVDKENGIECVYHICDTHSWQAAQHYLLPSEMFNLLLFESNAGNVTFAERKYTLQTTSSGEDEQRYWRVPIVIDDKKYALLCELDIASETSANALLKFCPIPQPEERGKETFPEVACRILGEMLAASVSHRHEKLAALRDIFTQHWLGERRQTIARKFKSPTGECTSRIALVVSAQKLMSEDGGRVVWDKKQVRIAETFEGAKKMKEGEILVK